MTIRYTLCTQFRKLAHWKNKIFLMLVLASAVQERAVGQQFEWAKQIGSPNSEWPGVVAVDAEGFIYTAGSFEETIDLDPGSEEQNITAAGDYDSFICKLDPLGDLVWAKTFGGNGTDVITCMVIDAEGNIYASGNYSGTADFDSGEGLYELTTAGQSDVFASKWDASGNFLWAKSMGGEEYDNGNSLSVDGDGNVLLTGDFAMSADFDPGPGEFMLVSATDMDIFIVKLDPQGNLLWAARMGSIGFDIGKAIAADAAGNVYTTGTFEATVDFDPGNGTFEITTTPGFGGIGTVDIFITKLSAAGNFIWAKSIGGNDYDSPQAMVVDADGNISITGWFRGTTDFDPGDGILSLTAPNANEDIFVVRLDAEGMAGWARQMGGTADDKGYGISLDVAGNVYTTGSFELEADFDPGAGTVTLTAPVDGFNAGTDAFISKLDNNGNFAWAAQLGADIGDESGQSIVVDAEGSVYTTGSFGATCDFDFSGATNALTSYGLNDIFIHKMSQESIIHVMDEDPTRAIVYPNPAHSFLAIETGETITSVIIYNATGACVLKENRKTFSIEQLPAGIYVVEVESPNGTSQIRIVKE